MDQSMQSLVLELVSRKSRPVSQEDMMRHSKSKVGMALFGGIIELYEDLFFERISMEKSTMELLNQGMKCLVNGILSGRGLKAERMTVGCCMPEIESLSTLKPKPYDKHKG